MSIDNTSGDYVEIQPVSYTSEAPTMFLRFVMRDGKRILQQKWASQTIDARGWVVGGTEAWRDIPLEEEK
jgi:hypothetical protein